MKILDSKQLKQADLATIRMQGTDSLALMEQASELIAQWLCNNLEAGSELLFFVGKGNNAGDGLAVARMLANVGFNCSVLFAYEPKKSDLSSECYANFKRLPKSVTRYTDVQEIPFSENTVIIDALLGVGINGPAREPISALIELINSLPNRVISIDIPSGMSTDFSLGEQLIVKADSTLSIYAPMLSMLLPDVGEYCGKIEVMNLELDEGFVDSLESPYRYITQEDVASLVEKRAKYSYKNNYGHTLLVCGSATMMGAASLALGAALRSGCGLVSLHLPYSQRFPIQANYPSAILSYDANECFSSVPDQLSKYSSIGIGCGLGCADETKLAFIQLLKASSKTPMVLDADALNILAMHPELMSLVPEGSILTPHPGELKRLVGQWGSEEEKMELVLNLAFSLQSVVVVKGAHTMICRPNGEFYFNSTGTPAMAKAGCGDVLCGFIAGLMARGYNATKASVLGVYLHARAAEKGADYFGAEALNSGDLVDFLAEAYSELE